ncbi:MAG: ketol-acid reductoisomerase [Acidobacteriota bacterium]
MRLLRDADAHLEYLRDKTVAVIGYGNQGRAQALNLRDSGIRVLIGSVRDEGAEQAEKDRFQVVSIGEAAGQADALALLIPDEVQPRVYHEEIADRLRPGQVLDFAHGYNIHYGLIRPPGDIDVVMVAPRMIGVNVRRSFQKGRGVPAYVAVAQDGSGKAHQIALAWAKAIGATRAGVLEVTFAQETELDLFTEQATWPIILRDLLLSYEVLVDGGFPPEMVALELYGSGEASEIFRQMARVGIIDQMGLHSQTSQYGTLSRGPRMLPDAVKERMRGVLEEIRSDSFAKEWTEEQKQGYPAFERLRDQARGHAINRAEGLIREMMKRAGLDEE